MRSRTRSGFRIASLALALAAVFTASRAAHADDEDPAKGKFTIAEATKGLKGPASAPLVATIETTMGTFNCELYDKKSPITVANFVGLARGVRPWKDPKTGAWVKKPFFDGLIFHRVIPSFMIQGGDPLGVGRGNPGYKFQNENDPSLVFDKPGVLAMANAGRDTNGSQFFITETPQPALNGGYTIFGQCDNTALVGQIARVERAPGDKPIKDVVMKKVTIARGKAGKGDKVEKKAKAEKAP
ncbi:MAG TPA: peptidylprolyl isomerase [Polyangia bacterium]|nr:peptidylprolyl isomerase [Polyangia bacterium]